MSSCGRRDAPQSAFAAEQLIDELAYMAKMDPVAFRLKNIANADEPIRRRSGGRTCSTSVAKDANWQPQVAASNLSSANVVTGRGIAFGTTRTRMTCCVADIEVNKRTGKITVKHAVRRAATPASIVYPDGQREQRGGRRHQGLSRALYEQVDVQQEAASRASTGSRYPMMRFKDAPKVTSTALSAPTCRTTPARRRRLAHDRLGRAGARRRSPAAIANAFFDATGVRIREAPMTPARVRAVPRSRGK